MEDRLKKILRAISLETRHILEGQNGEAGDLEQQLNRLGIWRNRSKPIEEMPHLSTEDKEARRVVDAYLDFRQEAGVTREDAVAEFIRESAYTWANRLFALRIMEARGIIDEVILKKEVYGGRSLVHNRFAKKDPESCRGEDDGLFAILFSEFQERSKDLPDVFNPESPATKLRPSVAALRRSIDLLSGLEKPRNQGAATDEVFEAPDAFGWMYQYWNSEEKDRIFENVRTKKTKIEGQDIIPATQLYTEPYMVKFLVQNSLGAAWMGMHPESKLFERWEYYVRDFSRTSVEIKSVSEITFMDLACGSGHFHIEAFDLFYEMYTQEGLLRDPKEICESILNKNLFGIDIDNRAVQIAKSVLWLKAVEKAPDLKGAQLRDFHDHIIATNIKLPKGKDHLESFLLKHRDDEPLKPAIEAVFKGLENAGELGSLIQIEQPVDEALKNLRLSGSLLLLGEDAGWDVWKRSLLTRLKDHFIEESQTTDLAYSYFSLFAIRGLSIFDLLTQEYDVVATNPPYMGGRNISKFLKSYLEKNYPSSSSDLYAAFILRCNQLSSISALVCMNTFMYITRFASLREGLLNSKPPIIVADLGTGAFAEISGEVVNVVLMILEKRKSDYTWYSDVTAMQYPEKPSFLSNNANFKKVDLEAIKNIDEYPFIFRAIPEFYSWAKKGRPLSQILDCVLACKTSNNQRFLRYWWEVPNSSVRWQFYEKESIGLPFYSSPSYVIDWSTGAQKYYQDHFSAQLPNPQYRFREGIVVSSIMSSSATARIISKRFLADMAVKLVFSKSQDISLYSILAFLSSKYCVYATRLLNPTINSQPGDIKRLPFGWVILENAKELEEMGKRGYSISKEYASIEIDRIDYKCPVNTFKSLSQFLDNYISIESGLIKSLQENLRNLNQFLSVALSVTNRSGDSIDRFLLKSPSISLDDFDEVHEPNTSEIEIIHDIPYFCENWINSIILKSLGHRWPKQIEAGEPLPDWSDKDGIIPLTEGCGEKTFLDLVQERIAEDFPRGKVQDIEHEFEEIMGTSLDKWLAGPFFKHHISQFKKRPIVWQIESKPPNGGGKGRKARQTPVFSCLVYYHKLDVDLLHKIRTQYVWNLRDRFQTEFRTLENMASPSNIQLERLGSLRRWIEELKDFDARLEQVSLNGFDCAKLKEIVDQEALDKWTSRDGQAASPVTKEEFYLQEKRYDPDINDGVRVNIAPLQIADLLSADVLTKKDLEKAIQDRAEWRADERRWCRQGKLARPGWWKVEGQ